MMKALSLGGSLLWGCGGGEHLPWKASLPPPRPPILLYALASREHGNAMGCCGYAVLLHVRVHLREALLDVGLCTALPHSAKAEALGRVVQLWAGEWSVPGPSLPSPAFPPDCSGLPPRPKALNQRLPSRLT